MKQLSLLCGGVLLIVVILFFMSFSYSFADAKSKKESIKSISYPAIALDFEYNKNYAMSKLQDYWKLYLVNPWNRIPDEYSVTLKQLGNGQAIDKRCYPELQRMINDCRADGLSPLICSSYRTEGTQQILFNNKVSILMNQGYSKQDAKVEAGKSVAVPGTSEHQLGLAVDIVDAHNQKLDESQELTDVQKWLMKNSWKYGFILRYPNNKSKVTGIIYEPWHYRYVGKTAAKEIYKRGICLEEYLDAIRY